MVLCKYAFKRKMRAFKLPAGALSRVVPFLGFAYPVPPLFAFKGHYNRVN